MEEEQELVIVCDISGLPQPRATWYSGDKVIKAGKKYVMETTETTATLRLPRTVMEDSATFTLKLDNPVGEDSRSIPVTITRKPAANAACMGPLSH